MQHFRPCDGAIVHLQFTPDGETLLCVEGGDYWSAHRAVHRLERRTGVVAHTLDLCEPAWRDAVSYADDTETGRAFVSPDGTWVAVNRYFGDAVLLDLWDGRTGKWREEPFSNQSNFCADSAAWSPDGKLLVFASGTDGGGTHELERLRPGTGHRLPAIDFYPGSTVRELIFSPDQRSLAAFGYGSVYHVTPSGQETGSADFVELELEGIGEPGPVRFRPDGKEIAFSYGDELQFWDGRSTQAEVVKPKTDLLIQDLSYAPDGQLLALACADGSVRFWDRAAGREVQAYDWRVGVVHSVAFAPDGMTCAAGGERGDLIIWDVER